ncbi:MAG: hypothetical protein ACRDRH_05910 [Pseudonocardia sp.]
MKIETRTGDPDDPSCRAAWSRVDIALRVVGCRWLSRWAGVQAAVPPFTPGIGAPAARRVGLPRHLYQNADALELHHA